METVRQQIVAKSTELLGEGQFVYGSFKSKPHTPYGNYALDYTNNYFADNRTYCKIGTYIYRLVTDQKDFELEAKIEDMFDELEIPYQTITDEDITTQKVHCTEWAVTLVGRQRCILRYVAAWA